MRQDFHYTPPNVIFFVTFGCFAADQTRNHKAATRSTQMGCGKFLLCFCCLYIVVTYVSSLNNGLCLTPPSMCIFGTFNNYKLSNLLFDIWYRVHDSFSILFAVGWMVWERFRCNVDCQKDPENCIRFVLNKNISLARCVLLCIYVTSNRVKDLGVSVI